MSSLLKPLVTLVLEIFEEVLVAPELDQNANFFESGGKVDDCKVVGHKLSALLGEHVHGQALFDAPTATGLAAYLARYYSDAVHRYLGIKQQGVDSQVQNIIDSFDMETVRRFIPELKPRVSPRKKQNKSAAFILSAPRSGSTLFRAMLAAHKHLFVPPELNLLAFDSMSERRTACKGRYEFMLEGAIQAVSRLHDCSIGAAGQILDGFEKQGLSTADFYQHIQSLIAEKLLVEKSTSYAMDINVLKRAETEFRQARYIHLCRHPSAVTQSFEDVRFDRLFFRGAHSFSAGELGELMWLIYNQNICNFLADIPAERQLKVRFEDLVQSPRSVISEVCSFLQIPFSESLLQPYGDSGLRMTGGNAAEDPKFYLFNKIEADSAKRWQSNPNRRCLWGETWALANQLNYKHPQISSPERQKILVHWNSTETSYPDNLCMQKLFEQQVERTADDIALELEGRKLSYKQLNEASNQLARYLMDQDIVPGMLVAMCLERSVDAVVTLLAILKAGAAYIPIDPELPAKRIQFMLKDAGVEVCISTQMLIDSSMGGECVRYVCLEQARRAVSHQPRTNPVNTVNSHQIAYTIFTSGSSGQPKGVMIEHHSFCNTVLSHIRTLELGPGNRVLHLVSLSFDAGSLHLLMSLCSGATVVMTDKVTFGKDPVSLLREQAITHLPLPASVLEALPYGELPLLKVITVGAEVCPPKLAERWASGRLFFNIYGPTEAAIICTSWRYEPGYRRLPIGRPIANTQIFILDESNQPVPVGMPGEIHIGGVGLARGYLNRPELTAEKFIQNPFAQGKLYKSGDLGLFLSNGNIIYLGRIDNQIKLSGFRIELEEIEAVIRRSGLVRNAAVIRHKSQLIAYVVCSEKAQSHSVLTDGLREQLFQLLPAHMVPATVIEVDRFPLTHAGKVDRVALGTLYIQSLVNQDLVVPRDDHERRVVRIWKEIFSLSSIGIQTNFLEIGGDSLLAVRLCACVAAEFEIAIEPEAIFRAQTVEQLSQLIRSKNVQPDSHLLPVYAQGNQMPVYFVQAGTSWQSLHRHLGEHRPIFGIKPFYGEIDVSKHDSITSLAKIFVDEIMLHQPEGPLCLGGYSLGAIVSLEIAHQLQAAGRRIDLLHLVDPVVTTRLRRQRSPMARLSDRASIAWNHLAYRVDIKTNPAYLALKRLITTRSTPVEHDKTTDQRHYDVDLYRRLADGYEFEIFTGRVLLSFTAGYRWRCWNPFLEGDVEYKRIFGLHEELVRNSDLSDQWIGQLSESLAGLDQENPGR